jgi:hypothetical protein
MKKLTLLLIAILGFALLVKSQSDSIKTGKPEKIKKGFSFGGVPAIAYDTDLGFKYGAVVNLYDYGDGSRYPEYNHSLYLEWSRTTKGNGINQIVYDSRALIPNMRVTAELSYMTEKALDFYGFNGYKSFYNSNFENKEHADYISRVFYRHERKSLRMKADFLGNIIGEKLRWAAGFSYNGSKIAKVDIDKLNKGKDAAEQLPNEKGLYDYYVDWDVISKEHADGGNASQLKLGMVYDTRDIEANPGSGIWSEIMLFASPKAFGYESFTTVALFVHRQYFTLAPGRLSLAYRLGYQTKLSGDIPFYMLPYSYADSKQVRDGFGGAKTVRGILRNRVVGDGVAFGNLEFRWKVVKTYFLKQNFYIALSGFVDGARVVDPYGLNLSKVPSTFTIKNKTYNSNTFFDNQDEGFHLGYGGGVRFALNENFIIAVDYGMAAKKDDGKSGLYIGLNWLF